MEPLCGMDLGIAGEGRVYRNLPIPRLVEKALARGEGCLSDTGALAVRTGKYTGRSPKDKFIVDSPRVHDEIAWDEVNVPSRGNASRRSGQRFLPISRGGSFSCLTASPVRIPNTARASG